MNCKLLSIFTLIGIFCLGNQVPDTIKQKQFRELLNKSLTNTKEIYLNGNKMLELSQSDWERSLAYNTMGDGKYKEGQYLAAIQYLEKADYYSQKSDSIKFRVFCNNLLVKSYKLAGLNKQAEEKWKDLQKIASSLPKWESDALLSQTRSRMFEIDGKFCEAAKYRQISLDNIKNHLSYVSPTDKKKFIYYSELLLCYPLIKCGRISEARSTFKNIEQHARELNGKQGNYLEEFYLLNKALLNEIDKGSDILTKDLLRKSYQLALISNSKENQKTILLERLSSNLENSEDKIGIIDSLLHISTYEAQKTKEISNHEFAIKDAIIEKKTTKIWIITTLISILISVAFISIYFNLKKKKEVRLYKKIVEDFKLSKEENTSLQKPQHKVVLDVIKKNETEIVILKNLEIFEAKKQFRTKGISIAHMAVMLKTNTKYLTYILKKYRHADFYTYINNYRIDYIVAELHQKPQLLQYKISAISDMCGYTSHSQFTAIFKQKKGISPSKYIQFLIEESINMQN